MSISEPAERKMRGEKDLKRERGQVPQARETRNPNSKGRKKNHCPTGHQGQKEKSGRRTRDKGGKGGGRGVAAGSSSREGGEGGGDQRPDAGSSKPAGAVPRWLHLKKTEQLQSETLRPGGGEHLSGLKVEGNGNHRSATRPRERRLSKSSAEQSEAQKIALNSRKVRGTDRTRKKKIIQKRAITVLRGKSQIVGATRQSCSTAGRGRPGILKTDVSI